MRAILALITMALVGCTNPDQTRELLAAHGMTDIQITGYSLLSCSDDDVYSTGFQATTANGTRVKGSVCAGMFFKGIQSP